MRIKIILLVIVTFISPACGNDSALGRQKETTVLENRNPKNENLNISILLDLSDRINPTKYPNPSMEFYKRDLGYIESISKGFQKHLSSKPIRLDNDQIQIYFEPEPLDNTINGLTKGLKLLFTKANTTKNTITEISTQYISSSSKIYEVAIRNKKYVGSDIWGFFKNKVNYYCIKPNHRNILFILTDGYMYHQDSKFKDHNKSSFITPELIKSLKLNTIKYNDLIEKNGYGFVKANSDLSNLEIIVLGLNPAKGNPFEVDVVKKYWNDWFKEMKVKNSIIMLTDLPSNLDPIIQKYINP